MPRSKTTPPIRFPQPLPGGPRSRAASTTTRKARRHVVYNPPATAAFKRADRLPPCASGRTVACLYQLSLLEHESISITHHSLQRYLNFPADELASFRHQRIDAPVVLACHHEPYRMIGPSGKIISRTPPKAFREHSDSPCLPPNEPNDALFTVAVVKPASPQNQFNLYNIHTHAHSTPLALMSLILAQHVTLQYVSDIDALQIWYHPPSQPTLTENALASLSVRLARWLIHAHAGARIAPLETPSYTKQWVYQAIRRTKSDTDQHHFVPFLEQVRHTTALNVTLRPYQQRAVAWMLSRELRPPKSQRFVEWHLANQLSNNQFFREQAALNHLTTEAHAVFDVFEGAICLGPLNDPRNRSVPGAFGGLLCDEMGLGKTVELMQLVLCNTRDAAEIHIRKRCSPSRSRICPVCDGICRAASQSTEHPVCRCVDCGRTAHRDCVKGSNAAKKDYVCPACIDYLYSLSKDDIRETEMPKSKATLIIIPTALLIQWKTEIEKHVRDALNVVVFQGLRISGYIPQQVLQEADVVLTTYDALRADVNVVNSIRKPRNSRRFERKYFPLPVPLLGVHWHRVALDESQMLGAGSNSYSQVAEMASYIRATYKWCVTGTPMSTDLCDVVPMLRLLNLEDSTENTNWVSLLRTSPYEEDQNRVARILRSIMWRTRMYDVQLTELNIPRRNFEVVHTLLGPVEKYHYNTLQDHVHQLTSTRRADAASVNLLHMLRQACCHPRIGASGRRLVAVASSSKRPRENCVQEAERRAKSPLDLNEVLESILLKSQVECEEEFRNLVASMNGQAAISLLQFSVRPARNRNVDRLISAVQLYRDILHLAQCNEDIVRMDDIQVMHVKFNLNDALQTVSNFRQHLQKLKKPSSIDRDALNELKKVGESVQDGNLSKDVDALREKYIAEAQANLQLATATYNAKFSKLGETPLMLIDSMSGSGAEVLVNGHISKVIAIDVDDAEASVYVSDANLKASAGEVRQKQKSMKTQWWEIGLAVLVEEGKDTAFVDKMVQRLTDVLAGEVTKVNTIATRLHNLNALARVISEGLREIQEARLAFRNVLLQLPGAREPTEEDVSESGYCSNCRDHGRGPKCSHCRAENLITNVEKNVYSLRERKDDEFETNADQSQEKETSEGIDVEAVVKGTFHSRGRASRFQSNSSRILYQGEIEVILLALAAVVRKQKDLVMTDQTNEWFERLSTIKEEHKDAKAMFEAQRSLLARLDEIKMAQMRMSVLDAKADPSHLTELELRHRIPRHRLNHMLVEFQSERRVAELSFQNTRGRLAYLKSLRKGVEGSASSDQGKTEIENFQSCPICLGGSDTLSSLAVFPCAHLFCCECALGMITNKNLRSSANSIQCPQCRTRCFVDEISFTSTSQDPARKRRRTGPSSSIPQEDSEILSLQKAANQGSPGPVETKADGDEDQIGKPSSFYNAEIEVMGQFGAKATALIRLLRSIWNRNDDEKVLIFSEWSEVLNLVRLSLERNNIPFCDGDQAKSSVAFAVIVDDFKSSNIRNVILLPLRKAGAGLNLTEASHVVLVEPSLQIALEAQAVGRVHRIGQTRETYVHRVIVRNTIEERILELGNKYRVDRNTSEEAVVDLNDVIQSIRSVQVSGHDSLPRSSQ